MPYFSVDVETTGLVPGFHDVLSIGAVEIDSGDEFHVVLYPYGHPALNWDEKTISDFWDKNPLAKERLTRLFHEQCVEGKSTVDKLQEFVEWVNKFNGNKYFVAWPASFDYPMVQYVLEYWKIPNPFNYRTVDIKSWLAGAFDVEIGADRSELPEWVWEEPEFPHDALEDARAQANVFRNLRDRKEN